MLFNLGGKIGRIRFLSLKLIFKFLISFTMIVMMISSVYAQPPTVLWDDAVDTNDLALSKDGNYVVVASGQEVRYYGRESGTPLWIKQLGSGPFGVNSVAISADGDCVAAGTSHIGGGEVYFWKNARTRTTSTADPTWNSVNLGGGIEYRCLDISDDGNYVVACGTGQWVFYWANAKGRTTTSESTSWKSEYFVHVRAVDLSSDGDYVVAGVYSSTGSTPAVAYWKNARSLTTDPQAYAWLSTEPDNAVVDVAVSDDGDYVSAATQADASVHYWADAKSLTGDPSSQWWGGQDVSFTSIDMSSDGDSVIAGSEGPTPKVYFWGAARSLTGRPQSPTWTYTADNGIHDVGINALGDFMVAAQSIMIPHKVFFFDRVGDLKWSFELDKSSHVVSISSNGDTVAVGTQEVNTAYLLDTGYSSLAPVGGITNPINKLEMLTPYLTLTGLIVAVTTVYFIKRRKD
ncbi:MAG: WD40 repeat domain-containing protein [Candidatus Bathyarchaeia archaeon]